MYIKIEQSLNFVIIQETYPTTPPVWFAESEDPIVTNAVQILTNTQGRDNHVINQVIQCILLITFQNLLITYDRA